MNNLINNNQENSISKLAQYYSKLDIGNYISGKYFSVNYSHKHDINTFEYNQEKIEIKVYIKILVLPKAFLSYYLQELFSKHLSEKSVKKLFDKLINQDSPIVKQISDNLIKEITLENYIKTLEKYLRKKLIKKWKYKGLNSFTVSSKKTFYINL